MAIWCFLLFLSWLSPGNITRGFGVKLHGLDEFSDVNLQSTATTTLEEEWASLPLKNNKKHQMCYKENDNL